MKLVGSLQEKHFRAELSRSHDHLFHEEDGARLLGLLKEKFGQPKTAYVLEWIPEQGEDICTVLVNDNIIADVEIARVNPAAEPLILRTTTVVEYSKTLKKIDQIKLTVALDLACTDLAQ